MEKVLTSAAQSESAAQRPSRIRCIETVIQRRRRHAQARMERGADRAVLGSALGTTPPSALTYAVISLTSLALARYALGGVTGRDHSVCLFSPRFEAKDRHIAEVWSECNPSRAVRKSTAEPELGVMNLPIPIAIADAAKQPDAAQFPSTLEQIYRSWLNMESEDS